ncbi:MAG: PEP/pyruvate-binding domain-containing protein [Saprospiraceae bacterium]
MVRFKTLSIVFVLFFFSFSTFSQKKDNSTIQKMVEKYKNDDRGPFLGIKWFCDDGTIKPSKEPCGDIGGVQRAQLKKEVELLGETNHVFLGQVLSTTSRTDFWDELNSNARIKQYQIEKYLQGVDDGWVLRKAQYYRGAIQVEDEEEWGINFFDLILKDEKRINKNFYLLRTAAKDIPHAGDNDLTQNIRALSKVVSDEYQPFYNLRVKIHGQPDASDIQSSKDFLEKNRGELAEKNLKELEEMIQAMEKLYRPIDLSSLNKYVKQISSKETIRKDLEDYINAHSSDFSAEKMMATSKMLLNLRKNITTVNSSKARLAMLDISIALEDILFKGAAEWKTPTYSSLMKKIYSLSEASAGCGYIEIWEWDEIKSRLPIENINKLPLPELLTWHEDARRVVEWGAGMARGVYQDEVDLFAGFEPLSYGFFDDKIRSSILLPLGNAVSELGNGVAVEAKFSNQILDINGQSSFRGLNAGYALGELVVIDGSAEDLEVSKDKIYVFQVPSSDLKPVAGIATVTEGNMVSHVQLLARNLGIPNSVLSDQNLNDLKKFHGKKIFYAVSNKGTVVMKLEEDMTEEEKKLFETKKRSEEKVNVPIEDIELKNTSVLNMRDIRSKDSGKIAGPKAANLGQLKAMFPDDVVEGIVIPFSIFRQHMDQSMPRQNITYWEFLNTTFAKAADISDEGKAEKFILGELTIFRKAIAEIEFQDSFVKDLEKSFREAFGQSMGKVPVFLRSDTNMEDLKDFTGAGLNLTLFNVLDDDKIMQGIRSVWASPYTERSYKWRQKFLLNPENVFPSILIIPSVDVEYSGVLITKGITSGQEDDLTVAFSRGAGGAVDGQAAESYLLTADGIDMLLSPAREPFYRRLPKSGGTSSNTTTFENRILNTKNLNSLRKLTDEVNRILPTTVGIESSGPFDIELGFENDKMWLFQIRPFVENKNAKGSEFLASITPQLPENKVVSLDGNIPEKVETEPSETSTGTEDEKKSNSWIWLVLLIVIVAIGGLYFYQTNKSDNA